MIKCYKIENFLHIRSHIIPQNYALTVENIKFFKAFLKHAVCNNKNIIIKIYFLTGKG